jgi:hypothetical protein
MNHTEFHTKLLELPDGANDIEYISKRYLLKNTKFTILPIESYSLCQYPD